MKRIINDDPGLILETPPQNSLDRLVILLNLMKQFPLQIDAFKFVEAQWLILNGHSTKAQEPFTKERIFWLIDPKSAFLNAPPP